MGFVIVSIITWGKAGLELLCDALQGAMPPVQAALDLYRILSESDTNLRQPVALEKQLLIDVDMDSEVGQSMLQLLQVLLILPTQASQPPQKNLSIPQ